MKKFTLIMAVFVLTFGLFCTTAQAANNNIKVTVDGKQITFTDAKPYVDKYTNRTMVPMRALGEALGGNVGYNNGQVTISKQAKNGANVEVGFFADEDLPDIWLDVNGEMWTSSMMDCTVVMKNNRTYLPARYVAERLGYTVDWNQATNTVIVKTNPEDLIFNATAKSISTSDLYGKWMFVDTYSGKTDDYINFEKPNNFSIKFYLNSSEAYPYEDTGAFNVQSNKKNRIDFEVKDEYYSFMLINDKTALISFGYPESDIMVTEKLIKVSN